MLNTPCGALRCGVSDTLRLGRHLVARMTRRSTHSEYLGPSEQSVETGDFVFARPDSWEGSQGLKGLWTFHSIDNMPFEMEGSWVDANSRSMRSSCLFKGSAYLDGEA